MPSIMPNGARYALYKTLGAAVVMSALSNANPAVASTATTPAAGSILLLTSGWSDLNGAVTRANAITLNTSMQLEGINTLSTTVYPPGEGVGTYQVASAPFTLQKVRDVESQGGEQQFFEYQYVEDRSRRQRRAPTFKSATTLQLMIDYDTSLAQFQEMVDLDAKQEPVVLRELLPNGDVIFYCGYFSFNKVPTKKINEFMTNVATFSLISDPVRLGPFALIEI